ncbi:hypothetical protein D3C74_369230 [compost metagenome]
MDCREDFHWDFTRVIAHELLIDLNDSAQFNVQFLRIFMRQVEINHVLAVHAQPHIHADAEDLTCCNITRNQVSVGRILFFEEVPRLAVFVSPDPSTFTTRGFGHETQLVIPWNGCWMNLNELPVSVIYTLLIHGTCRCTCVNDRVSRFTEDDTRTTTRQNNRFCREGLHLHRFQILSYNPATYAFIIQNRLQELPVLIFRNQARCFPATYLFV